MAKRKAKRQPKVHYHLTHNLGECGYHGQTTKDKTKVTCRFCQRILERQYPHLRGKLRRR